MVKAISSIQDTEKLVQEEGKPTLKDFITTFKMGIVNSNLITTFAGLWLGLQYTNEGFFDRLDSIIFVLLGTAFIIAGGCALNNYIDRDIDLLMERTKERPSATGQIPGKQVLWVGLLLSLIGVIWLTLSSYTAAFFGLIGLFVYVVIYTWWLKRTHSMNTIVGSISGAMPPLIGWAAIDPSLGTMTPWLMFLIMFLWQPPHFLALAMKRTEEYRVAGIPMLPVVAGFEMTKRQIIIYVSVLLPVSLVLYPLGVLYTVCAVLLGVGWLVLGITGLYKKDEKTTLKWAKAMFVFSLNYMVVLFVAMIVSVLI
ncbi:protoheme IX farnesyltransferase [Terrilactibacillus sp. BCM23-1]|uniref:Protoheme IX farnesyltransferase n=1 Tax=Terrilactibacillus tamarindi TaxID=2599694 RepID=A0A6N8CPE3_9BACI|nr:heme o synthase [Terrilactibacillus tamarindi]MTT31992.1 protoheme IX farnesyltransferase [Terrilactibacillus tamarindi]